MDLRLPCTTAREGTLTEPGLPRDVLPGGAACCLQWVPHRETGFVAGASPHYRTQLPLGCPFPTRPRWALHGRRSYTSNGLWTGLSISEVIGFIFILEPGCIFFIVTVACHNFSEMHTHPRALGSNKKLNKSTYYWWWIKTISGRVISSRGASVEEDSVILLGIF